MLNVRSQCKINYYKIRTNTIQSSEYQKGLKLLESVQRMDMRVVKGLEGPWGSSWGQLALACSVLRFPAGSFLLGCVSSCSTLEKQQLLFTNTRPSSCRAETYQFTPKYLASSQLHICFLPPGLSHLRQEALTAYFPSMSARNRLSSSNSCTVLL